MKKLFCLLLLFGLMGTTPALAAEQVGVYVAPKLVYGLTQMNSVQTHASMGGDSGTLRIGNKTDGTLGGSFAIGYDFEKKFSIPVRAELEYAGFSKAEAKRTFRDGGDRHTIKQTFNIQTLFVNAYWWQNKALARCRPIARRASFSA